MRTYDNHDGVMALNSLESTSRKIQKSLQSLKTSFPFYETAKEREKALQIGISALHHFLNEEPISYADSEIQRTIQVFLDIQKELLIMSKKDSLGASQKTLLQRRFIAHQMVIEILEDSLHP